MGKRRERKGKEEQSREINKREGEKGWKENVIGSNFGEVDAADRCAVYVQKIIALLAEIGGGERAARTTSSAPMTSLPVGSSRRSSRRTTRRHCPARTCWRQPLTRLSR